MLVGPNFYVLLKYLAWSLWTVFQRHVNARSTWCWQQFLLNSSRVFLLQVFLQNRVYFFFIILNFNDCGFNCWSSIIFFYTKCLKLKFRNFKIIDWNSRLESAIVVFWCWRISFIWIAAGMNSATCRFAFWIFGRSLSRLLNILAAPSYLLKFLFAGLNDVNKRSRLNYFNVDNFDISVVTMSH